MKNLQSLSIILLAAILLTDCKKGDANDPQSAACQPPTALVAQAPCESGYPGALLIVSAYQGRSPIQFVYAIYVQKDTLSNNVTSSNYRNASNERIIISETVLKEAPKFVVQVTVTCEGKEYPSRFFSFVKRPIDRTGCYVWARQTL